MNYIVASRSGGVLRFRKLDRDLHAVRKAGREYSLTVHRLDDLASSTDVELRSTLHLRHRGLAHTEQSAIVS